MQSRHRRVLANWAHFLARADWGCKDGEHSAWLIVEVDTKDEARAIVPADFRGKARVVQLTTFTTADMDRARAAHQL